MADVLVFATFLEQGGPQDAKKEGDGEKFRMSERQRVAELPSPPIFARLAEILSQKPWRLPLSAMLKKLKTRKNQAIRQG